MTHIIDTQIDHFVIAAKTLEHGINYVQSQLDIKIPYGGSHPKMGTHNHLLNLGNTFLEVIAIDPDTSPVRSPRWYNLDNPVMQEQLAQSPKLITWVVRTNDIRITSSQTNIPLGIIETVSRGNLTWKITVPIDGCLPEQGIFPTLIEWPQGVQPWKSMKNMDYSFTKLNMIHNAPDLINNELKNIGLMSSEIEITKNRNHNLLLHLKNSSGQLKIIK